MDALLGLALDPRPHPTLAPSALLALLDPDSILPRLCFPVDASAEAGSSSGQKQQAGAEEPLLPEYDGTDPGGYLVLAGLRPLMAHTLMAVSEPEGALAPQEGDVGVLECDE